MENFKETKIATELKPSLVKFDDEFRGTEQGIRELSNKIWEKINRISATMLSDSTDPRKEQDPPRDAVDSLNRTLFSLEESRDRLYRCLELLDTIVE